MESTPLNWLSLPQAERQQRIRQFIARQTQVDYIQLVSAGDMGVYASLGVHFDYAIFGRDSIQVAEDLLGSHQALAHKIILTLAKLQGTTTNPKSEEEPGKIHHEYRSRLFNGQPIPEISLNIMKRLQLVWGSEGSDSLRYYGSIDATPLYIRLVAAYVKRYGQDFLNEIYTALDGEKRIADSIHAATTWLVKRVESSPWFLLEYKRLNKDAGIVNQAWKDSATSYLHLDGQLANYDGGIASLELQGYTHDALTLASALVAKNETERRNWLDLAAQIRQQTLQRLWMPDQKFFAQGLDRGPDGLTRQIQTLTSNAGGLLDSGLLADLPKAEQSKYIDAVSQMITGPEFMTPAGIRSRALKHKQMPGYVDYHGSYTVWPKETYAIARGLKRYGKAKEAEHLQSTILDSIMRAGEFYEFFYVSDKGQVWYDKEEAISHFKNLGLGDNIATPENGQAWTISAVQAILSGL